MLMIACCIRKQCQELTSSLICAQRGGSPFHIPAPDTVFSCPWCMGVIREHSSVIILSPSGPIAAHSLRAVFILTSTNTHTLTGNCRCSKHLNRNIICYLLCVQTDHRSVQLRLERLPLSHTLTEMLVLLDLWDPCLDNMHKPPILALIWDTNVVKMSSFWKCNRSWQSTKVKNSCVHTLGSQPKSRSMKTF